MAVSFIGGGNIMAVSFIGGGNIMAVSFIGGGNWSTRRNHRPAVSHRQTLSHNVISRTPSHEWDWKSQH